MNTMRQLSRIIFIQSASVPYADVMLNGNIHLIGTQGVGKSTLLRAILFFYNANSLKLGISRVKSSFSDYYFKYNNSSILYEVERETGKYTVLLSKSRAKLEYRFIDSAYDRNFFVSKDGEAFSWDGIRQNLDKNGIYYSKPISKFEEFRDVIYGNSRESAFKKYSIIESRMYKNIPRTIQNVFLNTKLEAQFIKETIIKSIHEEDISINLERYGHELSNFEDQIEDIKNFKKPTTTKLADTIIKSHHSIVLKSSDLQKSKSILEAKISYNEKELPHLHEKLVKIESYIEKIKSKIGSTSRTFEGKKRDIIQEIGTIGSYVKKGQALIEKYQKMGIDEILTRSLKKDDMMIKESALQKELSILTSAYNSITEKFDSLIQALKQEESAFKNSLDKKRNQLKDEFYEKKERIEHESKRAVEKIKRAFAPKETELIETIENSKTHLHELKVKQERIRYRNYFSDERASYEKQLKELDAKLLGAESDKEKYKNQKMHLETTYAQEIEHLENLASFESKNSERERDVLLTIQEETQGKLDSLKDSFCSWLDTNSPNWKKSIGLVCSEDILLSNELSPTLDKGDSLFGVKLNLKTRELQVKTAEEYSAILREQEQQLTELSKKYIKLEENLNSDKQKVGKKYKGKIADVKELIQRAEYDLEQNSTKKQTLILEFDSLEQKIADTRRAELDKIEQEIYHVSDTIEAELKELERERNAHKRAIKSEDNIMGDDIKKLQADMAEKELLLQEESREKQQNIEARRAKILSSKSDALQNEGADTKEIDRINREVTLIAAELSYIQKNAGTVFAYQKDKLEYIDNIEMFKKEKREQEKLLKELEESFETEQKKLKKDEALQYNEKGEIKNSVTAIENDFVAYKNIVEVEWYTPISTDSVVHDIVNYKVQELISALWRGRTAIDDLKRELLTQVNRFLAIFSHNNQFSFDPKIDSEDDAMSFTSVLKEFNEEGKIDEYERRTNEMFSEVVKTIGSEMTELSSREGEIAKIITKINKGFETGNFVGVIKSIAIRLEESNNKIIRILQSIRAFNDENMHSLGGSNLFSLTGNDDANRKAVTLLKELVKEIKNSKKTDISLSDSFDLKFRIEENSNDTGWVENLSSVGSEGTDVLVKAMINVMLLDVFKESASKRFKDFRLHCMMDEIGKLHPTNIRGILKFANDRNIFLINGSPTEYDASAYKHIYKLSKDKESNTVVKRIVSFNK